VPLAVGHRIGEFEIKDVLGNGGMATVYRAVWTTRGTEVALKVLHAHIAEDPTSVERFLREVRAAEKLSNPHPHPHIAQIFASGSSGKDYYLAMELLRGGSLRDRLRKGKMPIAEAVKITQAVAQALDHAHQRGIIHRDVSPQNIMFDEKGQVKLTDFGIAKVMDEATITQGPIGKAPYMSPEQCRGDANIKGPSDLYALGIVLYEMVDGRPPFTGPFHKVMQDHQRTPPRKMTNPDAPAELQTVVSKALAKDPRKRFQNGAEMVTALKGVPVDTVRWIKVTVCASTGHRASPNCRKKMEAFFPQGGEPKTACHFCQPRRSVWQRLMELFVPQRQMPPTPDPPKPPTETVTPVGANGRSRGARPSRQKRLIVSLMLVVILTIASVSAYFLSEEVRIEIGGGPVVPIPLPPDGRGVTWTQVREALRDANYAEAKRLAEMLGQQRPREQPNAQQVIHAINAHLKAKQVDAQPQTWKTAWEKEWQSVNVADIPDALKTDIEAWQKEDREKLAEIGWQRLNRVLSEHPMWLGQDHYAALQFIAGTLEVENGKAKLQEFNQSPTKVCTAQGLIPHDRCPKPPAKSEKRYYLQGREPQEKCHQCSRPPDHVTATVCAVSHQRPNPRRQCRKGSQTFPVGAQPSRQCNVCPLKNVPVYVCGISGKRASRWCRSKEKQPAPGPRETCTLCRPDS
jgi:serine/threonine protein kinase